ncbi:PhzF family phenazine biosynthesis protein [Enterococcus termitis]|uniref:Phenazine biosynthesis protein PhzF n=1 Tax=Enterococcus termitis TaxID=332950 RepID=A0A1E5G7S5_9ENTE|nr:PhzF family phenazine biosynthesis isomerase [Enterococcus termitis]OEG08756.1 phenazine biosynthesis protein PhzF [Enterococcus termitis]OJG98233.1 PhzF family phenazine biosynthesis protein [Enterococcus termitis]
MECTVLRIDAFTETPGQGNPAGVVLDGDRFSTEDMQKIAKRVGYNETVFCCTSESADVKLRYFTPGHETPLCGHATMGSLFALYQNKGSRKLTIETGAGLLPVYYNDELNQLTMTQATPRFIDFEGDQAALCASLGIQLSDLDHHLPIKYGNTGSWTLILPVKDVSVLDAMKPDSKRFPELLKEVPKASIHPITILSQDEGIMTARHFSSPFSGTTEDSVTGTASGVMGAYALNHIYPKAERKELTIFQGKQVKKEGQVLVHVSRGIKGAHTVQITGTACFNEAIKVVLDD